MSDRNLELEEEMESGVFLSRDDWRRQALEWRQRTEVAERTMDYLRSLLKRAVGYIECIEAQRNMKLQIGNDIRDELNRGAK